MEKVLDWKQKEARAKQMSMEELVGAQKDCLECMKQGIDEGYYADEASVYKKEINQRLTKKERKPMSGMPKYINRKAVKAYFHRFNKQIGTDGLDTMDLAVEVLMQRCLRYANHFSRIKPSEIELAVKKA